MKYYKILTRCIIVVNSNGKIPRHIGDWIPSLDGKINASFLRIKIIKVEKHFGRLESCSLKISYLTSSHVRVKILLLDDITSRYCYV